jgi:hypothetical protein
MNHVNVFFVLVLLTLSSANVGAQTFENLSLNIEGRNVRMNGGERGSAGMSSGTLVLGKRLTAVFSQPPEMCGVGVKPYGDVDANATSGWTVHATPVRVKDDAVTIRVQWVRSRSAGKDSMSPGGELELTLQPGQSLPLDVVELAPTTAPYQNCGMLATLLRVGIEYWPRPQDDRRLVATDLWLIERLPDGTERSQLQSLRGQLNQRTPFYFDTVVDRGVSLDFFGEFTPIFDNGSLVVKFETRSRLIHEGNSSLTLPVNGNLYMARRVESTLRLKGDQVVAIQLPRLSENETGAFADRSYSIRIRSKQIR